jgi:hypothetical protein
METITHKYLTKLRIIAKIPENGRLDTTQNDLNVYNASVLSWIWRKLQGDGKHNSIKYLNDLYKEINTFTDQLMNSINLEQNSTWKHKKYTLLISLSEKMKDSLIGIKNLKGTYAEYPKVISTLECIESDIVEPQYETLLQFIPRSLHTQILKSGITYATLENKERCITPSVPMDIPKTPLKEHSSLYNTPVCLSHSNNISHSNTVEKSLNLSISHPCSEYTNSL